MRFRFLGDGDCPDWLLAEINALSRMTSIKVKLLGQLLVKSIISGNELDEDKVKKLTYDAKLEFEDAKAIIAALELILMSSVRYGVNATDLSSELQQLGLPREHSVAIGRLHTDNFNSILDSLTSQSLRSSHLSAGEILPSDEGTSSFIKMSLKLKKLDGTETSTSINVPKSQVPVLLEEMKRVRATMEDM
ncbi:COMM domain-containing protein 4 [Diachasmimorpha longicaudata]|uniref:COMM domain-containing protein 4 n=1 Tax=Diachasmimorpha longicaudata TaxID=58733 RepID=UPI0030B905BE